MLEIEADVRRGFVLKLKEKRDSYARHSETDGARVHRIGSKDKYPLFID